MKMIKLTLTDGTTKELTLEEAMQINLMEGCNGQAIIKTEFFEESGK